MNGTQVQLHGILADRPAERAAGSVPPHDLLSCSTLTAVISRWPEEAEGTTLAPEIMASRALAHHQILQAYCAELAVLPIRFGTAFSSASALMLAVASQQALYDTALAELRKLREYSLHLTLSGAPAAPAATPADGRAFLSGRRDQRDQRRQIGRRRQAFSETLHDRLARLCHDAPRPSSPRPDRLLDLSFLLPKSLLPDLKHLAAEQSLQAAALGLTLHLSGPWPAYSYALRGHPETELCHGA